MPRVSQAEHILAFPFGNERCGRTHGSEQHCVDGWALVTSGTSDPIDELRTYNRAHAGRAHTRPRDRRQAGEGCRR